MTVGGNVILFTGASSGIVVASARKAAEAGWRVALAARSLDTLKTLAADTRADKAKIFEVDVTDCAAQENRVASALAHYGRIVAVFANARTGGR